MILALLIIGLAVLVAVLAETPTGPTVIDPKTGSYAHTNEDGDIDEL